MCPEGTAAAPIPCAEIRPGTLPAEALFHAWRRSIAPMMDSVPLADPAAPPVLPDIRSYHLGTFLFMDTTFSRQKFCRDAEWGRRNDDAENLALQVFLRGSNRVLNGAADFVQQPGCVTAVNMGHEIDAVCTDAEVLTILLSRTGADEAIPGLGSRIGLLFLPGTAATHLFTGFLHSLRETLPAARDGDQALITESLFGLLAPLVAHGDADARSATRGLFAAICRHIQDSLGDEALGVETLCRRFGCSRATLYRLFRDHGGVQSYILRRRLMAAFRAITSPGQMHRQVLEIALDNGFTSASHFSTLFRKHFGITPRDAREAGRARLIDAAPMDLEAPGDPLDDAALMQRWARSLTGTGRGAL